MTLLETSGRVALRADNISVAYPTRYHERRRSRLGFSYNVRRRSEVLALDDVSLTLHHGEIVGMIGVNGSGKSTLMRVLAGVLAPNRGEVFARSEPSMLSIGATLNARYTGRRNIEMGGLALGWSMDEVRERLPGIVEFAELNDALDRPLSTYSSGMRARLGFAIATSTRPEILLIDEALSVGDEGFKEKSQERIAELTAGNSTVMIVTHNLAAVRAQCHRTFWLERGRLRAEGDTDEVVDEYIAVVRGVAPAPARSKTRSSG